MFEKYPHTDLHELNLDWIIKKVKELSTAWAQVQQDWTDEQAAFANLQSWIENYFNNLDVQTEINVKLDSMVVAGTMSELIAPYVASGLPAEVADQIGDVVAAQIGPVVAAQISAVVADQLPAVAAAAAAQEVSAWLALHVNPDTGYVIDDSFTVQGAAADAKAVGDEFTAIKSALNDVVDEIHSTNVIPRDNVSGYINETTGAFVDNYPPYYHTHKIPCITDKTYVCVKWKYTNSNSFTNVRCIAFYDESDTCVSVIDNRTPKDAVFTIPNTAVTFATDCGFDGIPFGYFSNEATFDPSLYDEYSVTHKVKEEALPTIKMSDTDFFVDGKLPTSYLNDDVVKVSDPDVEVYKTANVSTTASYTGYTYGLIKVQGEASDMDILIVFNSVVNCTKLRVMQGSTFTSADCPIMTTDGITYAFASVKTTDDWIVLLASSEGTMSANVVSYDCTGMPLDYDTVKHFVSKTITPSLVSDLLYAPEKNTWKNKKVLCIGDSLTAAGVWQNQLNVILGMEVYTHALGGAGMLTLIDGGSTSVGTISALSTDDVSDKDLIIFFAGYNDRGLADGDSGDVYPTNNTIAGRLQYCLNAIYNLLDQSNNLDCRVVVITPHCAGKYPQIPYDGYTDYPTGTGRSMKTMANIMEVVANDNNIPCYNTWKNSGISRFTWDVYSASPVATIEGVVQDQLHLNISVGYPYLGKCISKFISTC